MFCPGLHESNQANLCGEWAVLFLHPFNRMENAFSEEMALRQKIQIHATSGRNPSEYCSAIVIELKAGYDSVFGKAN